MEALITIIAIWNDYRGSTIARRRQDDQDESGRYRYAYICIMSVPQLNNPLHGKTLESILTELVGHYGWEGLAAKINVKCFSENPSISSSLKFLRKTEWARKKLEDLYVATK